MIRAKKQPIDLTSGSIWRSLLSFFIPILAGSLLQQLYTTVDAMIVGQFVGKTGLAAIDSVYTLLKLPVNFLVGLSGGATIIISQYFGARLQEDLSRAVHTSVAFAFAGGAVLSVVGIIAAPVCLRLLGVPDDIFPAALSYVRIYFAGLSVSMVYNIGAGILRAVGDSQTPFLYLIASNVVNIALDSFFVIAMGWGVAGAAIATVLSQLVSAAFILYALIRTRLDCKLTLRRIRFHRPVLKSICLLGIPIALQSALYPVANMMVQSSINSMGTDNIAAWALCGKLDFMIWLVADSLGVAISTFAAQNFGARQYGRVREGVKIGTGITLGIVALISVVLFIWCEPLARLFIRADDADVIPLAGDILRFLAPLYFLYVFGETLAGAIRGTGETVKPMLLTLACTCILRIVWILAVVPQSHTMKTIIAVYPASWALAAICFVAYYGFYERKRLRPALVQRAMTNTQQ